MKTSLADIRVPNRDEPIRLAIGQRPEHHRLDDRVDSRCRTNPEAQHQNGDERERGVLAKLAKRHANGCRHLEASSRCRAGRIIGLPRLETSRIVRKSCCQDANRRRVQGFEGADARVILGGALGQRRAVEIFEVERKLVDGGVRQIGPGELGLLSYRSVPVETRRRRPLARHSSSGLVTQA